MIAPALPDNEAQRLSTLYQLNILDTEREERFDRITRIACKLFSVPIAFVSFVEAERQWIKSTHGFEITEAIRKTSFCAHAILKDEITIIEDATKDKRFFDNPFVIGEPHIRFYLGCPIKINHANVGILCLIDNKPRKKSSINESDVRDLTQMIELELEALHLSTTDELTGLSNRRGFLKIANYLFRSCQREDKPFSLLFFDLNKFKRINDDFGHSEGDRVLKSFSKSLLNHFRCYDVIARLGGDEFCVFCSGLEQDDVDNIALRMRNELKSRNLHNIDFSLGAVQYKKEKHKDLENMLKLADSKMYRDKERAKGYPFL